jgi:hypothetical protein
MSRAFCQGLLMLAEEVARVTKAVLGVREAEAGTGLVQQVNCPLKERDALSRFAQQDMAPADVVQPVGFPWGVINVLVEGEGLPEMGFRFSGIAQGRVGRAEVAVGVALPG